jgi:hypothetical protein
MSKGRGYLTTLLSRQAQPLPGARSLGVVPRVAPRTASPGDGPTRTAQSIRRIEAKPRIVEAVQPPRVGTSDTGERAPFAERREPSSVPSHTPPLAEPRRSTRLATEERRRDRGDRVGEKPIVVEQGVVRRRDVGPQESPAENAGGIELGAITEISNHWDGAVPVADASPMPSRSTGQPEAPLHSTIEMPARLDALQRTVVRQAVERRVRERLAADPVRRREPNARVEVRVDQVNVRIESPTPPTPAPAASRIGSAFDSFFLTRSLR